MSARVSGRTIRAMKGFKSFCASIHSAKAARTKCVRNLIDSSESTADMRGLRGSKYPAGTHWHAGIKQCRDDSKRGTLTGLRRKRKR